MLILKSSESWFRQLTAEARRSQRGSGIWMPSAESAAVLSSGAFGSFWVGQVLGILDDFWVIGGLN